MGVIKGVLKEELENSIQMKKEYEMALKANPGGAKDQTIGFSSRAFQQPGAR